MVKPTQKIRRQFGDELFECVWAFCWLKGLITPRHQKNLIKNLSSKKLSKGLIKKFIEKGYKSDRFKEQIRRDDQLRTSASTKWRRRKLEFHKLLDTREQLRKCQT